MRYRLDIDGLRAVAVLPVIFFHAGFASFKDFRLVPGGFVGVDIFFVISGFLISGIIYSEISEKTYSIFSFYARRVRRIFPAILLVYLACLAWGTWRSIGPDLEGIRNATLGSIFFVSNVYFANHAGYFNSEIQNNPLLHTWSLSIEEQFYIILPIILVILRRFSHNKRVIFLGLAVIGSLCASVYLSHAFPDLAYYSLAARAWELGIGGLLAITGLRIRSKLFAEALGLVGLLAIAASVVAIDPSNEFPSYTALLPTLGAAAIILSGSSVETSVSRLLSIRPIRWVGLISYSLYLWHWPILVIARLEGFGDRKSALAAIVLCFLVSWLSWRFVEQPFRAARRWAPAKRVVGAGVLAMAAVVAVALVSVPVNALLLPMTAQARTFASFDEMPSQTAMRPGTCFLTQRFGSISHYRPDLCLAQDPRRPNVLLIGDSHAAQYAGALAAVHPNINLMQATASGCLPLLNTRGEKRCVDLWNFVTQKFLPEHSVDVIILGGHWPEGSGSRVFATARHLRIFSKRIVIIGPNEESSIMMPRVLARASVFDDPSLIDRYIMTVRRRTDKELSILNSGDPGITYLSFFKAMCNSVCPMVSSAGDPLLFDDNHLTLSAATDTVKAMNLSRVFELDR